MDIWIYALLSQFRLIVVKSSTPKYLKSPINQITSQVVDAIHLYSASAEDPEIVLYFFVFQNIKDSPNLIQ